MAERSSEVLGGPAGPPNTSGARSSRRHGGRVGLHDGQVSTIRCCAPDVPMLLDGGMRLIEPACLWLMHIALVRGRTRSRRDLAHLW